MVIYGDIIGISWGYSWIMIERERAREGEREREIKVSRYQGIKVGQNPAAPVYVKMVPSFGTIR
jgi:hypothetical protein